MFDFLKLSGAPPKAFQYYRSTKDKVEKTILEDLYRAYDGFIKEEDTEMIRMQKLLSINNIGSFDDSETRRLIILSSAYDSLAKYGTSKGYPEYLVTLFYQGL